MQSKRELALQLAQQILDDIELNQAEPITIARKSYRLARLTEDGPSLSWLIFEVGGYPRSGPLDMSAWAAAEKSGRVYKVKDELYARTDSLGELSTRIATANAQLAVAMDVPSSISSANTSQFVHTPSGNALERNAMRSEAITSMRFLDRILGAIHLYVADKYQELKYGATVESAISTLRTRVDNRINNLVPEALSLLNTAFENAESADEHQWANAAKACRDLIKAAADALRPPGPPVDGRMMTDDKYVNRLVDWVNTNSKSKSGKKLVTSDVEYLGNGINAVLSGGHKGAHTKVDKAEAARYLIGTYLLLGDLLSIVDTSELDGNLSKPPIEEIAVPIDEPSQQAASVAPDVTNESLP